MGRTEPSLRATTHRTEPPIRPRDALRAVPGDRDLDAVLLLPLDESLDDVREAIAKRIESVGKPFELRVNDDGKSRWLVLLQPSADGAEPHHADLTVFPSSLFSEPMRGFDRSPVYATRVQRAFSTLCHCAHWPLRSASCFNDAPSCAPHSPRTPTRTRHTMLADSHDDGDDRIA